MEKYRTEIIVETRMCVNFIWHSCFDEIPYSCYCALKWRIPSEYSVVIASPPTCPDGKKTWCWTPKPPTYHFSLGVPCVVKGNPICVILVAIPDRLSLSIQNFIHLLVLL